MSFFKRESKHAQADYIDFGGERVAIPKLTIEKWRQLLDNIQALPQIIMDVLLNRGSANFTATVVAAIGVSLDEIIELVAVLTDKEPDWIEVNVSLTELLEFIQRTVEKNNLSEAGKKFRAVFGKLMQMPNAADPSPSTNGSSSAPSSSA